MTAGKKVRENWLSVTKKKPILALVMEELGRGGMFEKLKKLYVLSSAEQDGHDQRMGESDLEAIDQAVPCALENGEVVMVPRVVQDGLQCSRY